MSSIGKVILKTSILNKVIYLFLLYYVGRMH